MFHAHGSAGQPYNDLPLSTYALMRLATERCVEMGCSWSAKSWGFRFDGDDSDSDDVAEFELVSFSFLTPLMGLA